MKSIKIFAILFLTLINILFYTLGYPDTGFKGAMDIHPILGIFLSLVIATPLGAYIYFLITGK